MHKADEYERTGYLGYLPPELRQETRKFRRSNVPTCEPLLTVYQIQYSTNYALIQGWAQTQYGEDTWYHLNISRGAIPSLIQGIKAMDLGGPGPIILNPGTEFYAHIARLPPGVGMWQGRPGPDIYLYCHELIGAIAEAIDHLQRNPY